MVTKKCVQGNLKNGDIDFYANTVCYDVHCATDSLLNCGVIVI